MALRVLPQVHEIREELPLSLGETGLAGPGGSGACRLRAEAAAIGKKHRSRGVEHKEKLPMAPDIWVLGLAWPLLE